MQLALTKPNKHGTFVSSRIAATTKTAVVTRPRHVFPAIVSNGFFLCIVIGSDRSPWKRAVNDFC